jgi:hypothetical protein
MGRRRVGPVTAAARRSLVLLLFFNSHVPFSSSLLLAGTWRAMSMATGIIHRHVEGQRRMATGVVHREWRDGVNPSVLFFHRRRCRLARLRWSYK